MKKQLTGERLFKTAINQILENPETWDQSQWHSDCGTKHCIAGWCQILSGHPPRENAAREDAKKALELSDVESEYLFYRGRTISELHRFAENFNTRGYDASGYDASGYDTRGYDASGYNVRGYDASGYNASGYNTRGEKLQPFFVERLE